MNKIIPYSRQFIDKNDISSVIKILKSDMLTQGDGVLLFEKEISKYTGAKYASSFNSATSALHAACHALDVKKGDIVWTSPISFVASANCALYCGGTIDFVDINIDTYNISVSSLKKKLSEAKKINKLPKVLICVHLSGQSCEMEDIFKLSKIYNFKIIEDASHALGGLYKNKKIGNCKYSDVCIFSFHPVKMITTGEGGMAVTNKKNLHEKLKIFNSHGIDTSKRYINKSMKFFNQMVDLGFNYRLSDIHAALGMSQMKKINKFLKRRFEIKKYYNKEFGKLDLPIIIPHDHPDTISSNHLYIIRIKKNSKITRNQILERLRKRNIFVNVHYVPIYRHFFYQRMKIKNSDFPNSEIYGSQAISIPNFYGLKNGEIDEIIYKIKNLF
tara:strand:- start:13390 stop:14550 length:1161 start_codon:yes stop_codon:yes gene_type:complete